MKKIFYGLATLMLVAAVAGFVALGTTQTGLTLVRVDGVEDSSSLATAFFVKTQGDFGHKASDAWELPDTDDESAANAPIFYFTTDGEGLTFSAACYGYRAINGPAQLVCTIAATGGSQQVVAWPDTGTLVSNRTWVDTVVVTSFWPTTVTVGSSGGGNNVVTGVWFDGQGCKFFKWYVWDANGTAGAEASNVSIWGGYF